MKKTLLFLMLAIVSTVLCAQEKEKAEDLVSQGVDLHDKGSFAAAIALYDKALALDKDNLLALTEKAYSLLSYGKTDESIATCKKAIAIHPGEDALKIVYVTYGNALDGLKKSDESIAIYDEGIKQFPDYYMLHFNKGITLSGKKEYKKALLSLQKSAAINPNHSGTQNAIARLNDIEGHKIPALLAYCRFLALEPESGRSKENLTNAQKLMSSGMVKKENNQITINIDSEMFADTLANGKPGENSFASTEMLLLFTSALDGDKKNKKKTPSQQFLRKMEMICSSVGESKKDHFGFYWDYYVPYFAEMNEKGMTETFVYIAFASSGDKKVNKWLKSHKQQIQDFYSWSEGYVWAK